MQTGQIQTGQIQTGQSTPERATSFSAVNDGGTPASLRAFGGGYIFLWLGMLALVYVARRKQLALKAQLQSLENTLRAQG
jgi:hypothetical protein